MPKNADQPDADAAHVSQNPELDKIEDEAHEKGYYGEVPDETPNSAYTLRGVTSGEPTPETTRGEQKK